MLSKPHKDYPDFENVTPLERAALLAWIGYTMVPAKRYASGTTSYGMKHCFEEVGFYVTNAQFKAAMLSAGYKPKDREERNWTFKIKARNKPRSITPTLSEACGYTLDNLSPDELAGFNVLVETAKGSSRLATTA